MAQRLREKGAFITTIGAVFALTAVMRRRIKQVAAAKLQQERLEEVHALCTQFVPGWQDLSVSDVSIDLYTGGSGAFVAKVSSSAEVVPQCVAFKSGSSDAAAFALAAFQRSGAEFVGKVYLAGHSKHQGYLITEVAHGQDSGFGGTCSDGTDTLNMYKNHAAPYGTVLAKLHTHEFSWFNPEVEASTGWPFGPDGMSTGQVFEMLPAAVKAELDQHKQQAGILLRNLVSLWHAGPEVSSNEQFALLTEQDQKQVSEWFQLVAQQIQKVLLGMIDSNVLMDRVVMSHGDAHSKQFVAKNTHSSSELMVLDFDMMLYAPAWHDMGEPFGNHGFHHATLEPYPLPPLEERRTAARAYLSELGPEFCEQYLHSSVDDVVFDANKGVVSRWLKCVTWWIPRFWQHIEHGGKFHPAWRQLALCTRAGDILRKARQEPSLFNEVLQKGIVKVVLDEPATKQMMRWRLEPGCELDSEQKAMLARHLDLPLGPLPG